MQMTKRYCDLSNVELDFGLAKSAFGLHVVEDFAALQVVHDEVDAVGALEHKLHGDDEGVSDLEHD